MVQASYSGGYVVRAHGEEALPCRAGFKPAPNGRRERRLDPEGGLRP